MIHDKVRKGVIRAHGDKLCTILEEKNVLED